MLHLHTSSELKQVVTDIHITKQYVTMNDYEATGLAEGFIEAESEEQVIEAWQHLHDTGLAYKLQGWFGRTAQELLKQGIIQ